MNPYFAFANDYKQWDGIETVTVRANRFDVTKSDQIGYAKRDDTKRGLGKLANETVRGEVVDWHVPHQLLSNLKELQTSDRIYVASSGAIKPDTELWVVEQASKVRFGTEWIANSFRVDSAAAPHVVDIEKSVTAQDSETGAATETWATEKSKQPCWVRPFDARNSPVFFQEAADVDVLVYFFSAIELGTAHRLLFGSRRMAVQGPARNVDESDRLWIVPCLETPGAA